MSYEMVRNATEAALLKECYDLAGRFEKDSTVKEILINKSEKLRDVENPMGVKLGAQSLPPDGDAYSDSGEVEYRKALAVMKNSMSEARKLEAQRYVMAALQVYPQDPRYLALLEILNSQR